MIAKRFHSYTGENEFLVFASGVSNSKLNDSAEYAREMALLEKAIKKYPGKILVYFSACSVYDPEESGSRYVLHKKQIEEFIIENVERFSIFRVSNLVGQSDNPNTVLNFFVNHIRSGTNFDLWQNASRNLLDIDDLYKVVDFILKEHLFSNEIINIANPESYPVTTIVNAIEKVLDARPLFIPIQKGSMYNIDIKMIEPLYAQLGIRFTGNYLDQLIRKYYCSTGA